MNRQELKVAVVALALIGAAAFSLAMRKNTLGPPSLVLEPEGLTNVAGVKVTEVRVALPTGIPGYQDWQLPITDKEVEVLPKDTTMGRRLYRGEADQFFSQVSAVMMGSDRTSLHKPYYCVTGQGWRIEKYDVVSIPMSRPYPYELKAQLLTTIGEPNGRDQPPVRGLFMYWYVSDTQLAATHKEQMWLLGRDLVTQGELKRWSYISFFSMCKIGEERILLERMKQLAAEVVPRFQIAPGKDTETAFLDRPPGFN